MTESGAGAGKKFMGFKRDGRKPGARNDLWIIAADPGLMETLEVMAHEYHKPYWIDSVVLLGGAEAPFSEAYSLAWGLAANPNAAGLLLAGREGDELFISYVMDRLWMEGEGGSSHVRRMIIQGENPDESEETFCSLLDRLAAYSSRTRAGFDVSDLFVGLVYDEESRKLAHECAGRLVSLGCRAACANLAVSPEGSAYESLVFLGAQVIVETSIRTGASSCAVPVARIREIPELTERLSRGEPEHGELAGDIFSFVLSVF
ncbi:MAG: UxaA family hydrolase [Synergistaceae bacterium]|jgi:hypothetical protein|nr:UxaA family hydrolase [Synergistaceae bacterium]